jgi:selenocysteine lyase/cysteine desulfurase
MALGKKQEVGTRLTTEEIAKRSMELRSAAMEKALKCEKVRYKSPEDPEKFLNFLQHRLTIWEDLKEDTFHAKGMYEKTKKLIDEWN